MKPVEHSLYRIINLYKSGKTVEALYSFSLYLFDQNQCLVFKDLYYKNHLHDPELFDLSLYFLLYCERNEKLSLIDEWLGLDCSQLSDKQIAALKKLSQPIYCMH